MVLNRSCPAVSHYKPKTNYRITEQNSMKTSFKISIQVLRQTYNLKFDGLAVQLNSADLEINTNCGDIRLSVSIVRKTQQQT
jgi:hypothetical protein